MPKTAKELDWKRMARTLSATHNQEGASLIVPEGWTPDHGSVVLASSGPSYVRDGSELTAKEVRTWWWKTRTARIRSRRGLAVWSVYDAPSDRSLLGYGGYVPWGVALRLERKNPDAIVFWGSQMGAQ